MSSKLRKVEKDVLIPRYMEHKITHELCSEPAREFAECAKAKGLRVVIDCKSLLKKFEECTNRWFRDEEFKKQCEQEYLAKRKKFQETGEYERSPFKRF